MIEKARIIENAAHALLNNDLNTGSEIIKTEYPFTAPRDKVRKCKESQKISIFFRDHFIDRYSGDKLVNPGMLKALSHYFPQEFPYHPSWKQSVSHVAYWELVPTIDHIHPIANGGDDKESNWITTNMLHNKIKSNWSLEQLGWKIVDINNPEAWDGLSSMFLQLVQNDTELSSDPYIKRWRNLTIKALKPCYPHQN